MRERIAIAALVAAMALLCAAQAAAAGTSRSAQELLAGASRLNDQLALLGQGLRGFGPSSDRALLELKFENRDGYAISVLAFDQTVALSVSRRHGPRKRRKRASMTTYLAHGKVTPTSIDASFGDRGRIAVRFRPFGRDLRATRKAGCRRSSKRPLAQHGIFAGELRFRGEDGYTSARVHRVRGHSIDFDALLACLVGSPPGRHAVLPAPRSPFGLNVPGLAAMRWGAPQDVPGVRTHPNERPKATTLLADSKLPLARTLFAAQVRGEGRTRFAAIDARSEGAIGVIRFVNVRGARPAFAFDDSLAGASVAPPAPFSGRGTFQHSVAEAWTGSLAVSFLGAPRVPLAVSPFRARLLRNW